MGKHFWESDDEYRGRVNQEANEQTIESANGSAPSQKFWESDGDYRERISREASEAIVESSTGSAPSQGWFESDEDYRSRVIQEANERVISDSTGTAPSRGIFESDEHYRSRVSQEANQRTIEDAGTSSAQGWFESDRDYKNRLYTQAREIRSANQSPRDDSGGYHQDASIGIQHSGSQRKSSGHGVFWFIVLVLFVGALVRVFVTVNSRPIPENGNVSTGNTQVASSDPEPPQLAPEDIREHQLVQNARDFLAAGELKEALDACNEALILNAGDTSAVELKDQIQSALGDQESKREDGPSAIADGSGGASAPSAAVAQGQPELSPSTTTASEDSSLSVPSTVKPNGASAETTAGSTTPLENRPPLDVPPRSPYRPAVRPLVFQTDASRRGTLVVFQDHIEYRDSGMGSNGGPAPYGPNPANDFRVSCSDIVNVKSYGFRAVVFGAYQVVVSTHGKKFHVPALHGEFLERAIREQCGLALDGKR